VGEVVELNVHANLLSYDVLTHEDVMAEAKKNWFQLDKERRMAELYIYRFSEIGSPMRPRAKLKVLSYMGSAGAGSSTLFALVQVVSD
jgi:hypothetical protein